MNMDEIALAIAKLQNKITRLEKENEELKEKLKKYEQQEGED